MLIAGTCGGFFVAQPADALPPPVSPLLDCITVDSAGIVTAYFGYKNTGTIPYFIPVGTQNNVSPGAPFQGQPESFNPGIYPRVFRASFDSNIFASIDFLLNGSDAQATDDPSLLCKSGITAPASGITTNTATLNATIDPEGDTTTWHFAYGITTGYGQTTPDQTAPGIAPGPTAQSLGMTLVQAGITGLQPSTTYNFRVVAVNSRGTTNGANQTFTTPSAPTVTASPPSAASAASPLTAMPNFTG